MPAWGTPGQRRFAPGGHGRAGAMSSPLLGPGPPVPRGQLSPGPRRGPVLLARPEGAAVVRDDRERRRGGKRRADGGGDTVAFGRMDELEPRVRAVCDLNVAEAREYGGRHEDDGVPAALFPERRGWRGSLPAVG